MDEHHERHVDEPRGPNFSRQPNRTSDAKG